MDRGKGRGGVKGARGANANGDAENGEHGVRSRRQSAQMGVGRNVRGSRSAKRAPPSDALVDGGKRADKLSPVSPPFIFPFYFFFRLFSNRSPVPPSFPSCTVPLASTHTNHFPPSSSSVSLCPFINTFLSQ